MENRYWWRKNCSFSDFVDLKRAFETIDRDKLISKWKKYGITEWIKHLSDRYLRTKNDRCSREKIKTVYRVTQGSVIGPLLFILNLYEQFINLF